MAKRLDDTKALKAMPAFLGDNESVSVSVRKIDNGFVTTERSYSDDGYKCKETFSPVKPSVQMETNAPKSTTLSKAMEYLK